MATTTNYGWTTPDNTDLVKDGALAIRTLGSAIDTSMNTALGTKKAGMVLLNTTSFSAVASASLPANTFTATYDNYRVICDLTGVSNDGYFATRLRASGSDATGANYNFAFSGITGIGGGYNFAGANATFFTTGELDAANNGHFYTYVIDLFRPNLATQTTMTFNSAMITTSSSFVGNAGGALHALSTAYDSLTVFPQTGTISGRFQVFGYNQ